MPDISLQENARNKKSGPHGQYLKPTLLQNKIVFTILYYDLNNL